MTDLLVPPDEIERLTRERPILFQGDMVRAILSGSKTQTRRIVKGMALDWLQPGVFTPEFVAAPENDMCPYGKPGDRLWVRETWMPDAPRNGEWPDTEFYGCGMSPLSLIPECYRHPWHVMHRATYEGCDLVGWKPSIHMPRWASRITLEITEVRVERLNSISEVDAIAEGVNVHPDHHGKSRSSIYSPVQAYRDLWERINGSGSWEANPWVWCVSFRRIENV